MPGSVASIAPPPPIFHSALGVNYGEDGQPLGPEGYPLMPVGQVAEDGQPMRGTLPPATSWPPAGPDGQQFIAWCGPQVPTPSENFDYDEELRAAIALSLEGEDQPGVVCLDQRPASITTTSAASGTLHPLGDAKPIPMERSSLQEDARLTPHEEPPTPLQVVTTPASSTTLEGQDRDQYKPTAATELIGWAASAGGSMAIEKGNPDRPRSRMASAWTRFSAKLLSGLARDNCTAAPPAIDMAAMD